MPSSEPIPPPLQSKLLRCTIFCVTASPVYRRALKSTQCTWHALHRICSTLASTRVQELLEGASEQHQESWELAASFRYATGQAFTPAAARYQLDDPAVGPGADPGRVLSASRNSGRLLPYHRLDISGRRPISIFGKSAELVLEVFNLYNRRNEWFVQYDTEGDVTEATVVRQLPLIPSVGVNFEF